jgi:hypothetical protein
MSTGGYGDANHSPERTVAFVEDLLANPVGMVQIEPITALDRT